MISDNYIEKKINGENRLEQRVIKKGINPVTLQAIKSYINESTDLRYISILGKIYSKYKSPQEFEIQTGKIGNLEKQVLENTSPNLMNAIKENMDETQYIEILRKIHENNDN